MAEPRASEGAQGAEELRVLLMGHPNVGKSAVFSRLTGAQVMVSNYPGTTVSFTEGRMNANGRSCRVIDVPGTYSLEPASRAEEVAVEMIDKGDVVVNVVDSTNLERNLNLTLQLVKRRRPMVLALNMWDEALEHGVHIDIDALSARLGVPVVHTCAISGEGLRDLQQSLARACPGTLDYADEDRWRVVGEIVEQVQRVEHRHPTIGQELSHATVHRIIGPMIALVVLGVSFEAVRFAGEGLINYVMDPLFEHLWRPVVEWLSGLLGGGGLLHGLLIGKLVDGRIEFADSFGLLTTGLYIEFAAVLPYVLSFYVVLGILEDSGYLPRLGVLVDNVMHRLGLHGLTIMPMLMGLGCKVPGALALRVLETRKERFIAATLLSVCVPCVAQMAMVAGLIGRYGAPAFALVLGTLFLLWVILGVSMKRLVKGTVPEILLDIPPYRLPYWAGLGKKLLMRMKGFFRDAVPYVLLGVLVVRLLEMLGVIRWAGVALSPVVEHWFGLPPEAAGSLVIGFMRKDVAVGMLAPMGLSLKQLVIACVVLTAYFPCAATFFVLLRELGVRDMLKASAIMAAASLVTGGLLNLILTGLGL